MGAKVAAATIKLKQPTGATSRTLETTQASEDFATSVEAAIDAETAAG